MLILVVLQSPQQFDLTIKTLAASLKSGNNKVDACVIMLSGNFIRQTSACSNSSFVTYRCF